MPGELVMYDPLIVPGIMLTGGALLAFNGRRLVPFALVLLSLAAGILYGGAAAARISDDPAVVTWAPPVLAVVFCFVTIVLYRLAFFAAGFFLGFSMAGLLVPDGSLLLYLLMALGSGALVYFFRNFVFSVLTAIMGGVLFSTGFVNLAAWVGLFMGTGVYWAVLVIVSLSGVMVQLKAGRK